MKSSMACAYASCELAAASELRTAFFDCSKSGRRSIVLGLGRLVVFFRRAILAASYAAFSMVIPLEGKELEPRFSTPFLVASLKPFFPTVIRRFCSADGGIMAWVDMIQERTRGRLLAALRLGFYLAFEPVWMKHLQPHPNEADDARYSGDMAKPVTL